MEQFESEQLENDSPALGQGPDVQQTSIKWSRPPPPVLDPKKDALIFQQIEVDHYNGNSLLIKFNIKKEKKKILY